jgi:hypothetical protein
MIDRRVRRILSEVQPIFLLTVPVEVKYPYGYPLSKSGLGCRQGRFCLHQRGSAMESRDKQIDMTLSTSERYAEANLSSYGCSSVMFISSSIHFQIYPLSRNHSSFSIGCDFI